MADNFNLRTFLSENKLTKNTQTLSEGSDYGYEALMDVVDNEYDGDPAIAAAVEDAFNNGDIDTSEFGHDLNAASRAVAQIANGQDIEAAQNAVERDLYESKLTAKERRLVEMVQNALGIQEEENVDYTMGRQDDPNQLPNPAPELNIPEGEESIEEGKPLPKYNSIEELMKEIENGTNEAAHKYKMDEMKRVYEALEAKVGSLEEGEHAEHIDQKAVKQMRKDITALRKAEEKLRKEFEKKFTGKEKKETPKKVEKEAATEAASEALQEGTFDLRKFLAENKLTASSRMLSEVLQQMKWEDVGPKLLPIAQKYNLFTMQQPIERSSFINKVETLNGDFSQVGQGMVGVIANVSGAGGVDLLAYSSEKVDTLKSFFSELKKIFPSITDVGHNNKYGSYLQISNFSHDTEAAQ
jgi:hypothetical protein